MTITALGTLRTDNRPFKFLHSSDLHLGAAKNVMAAFDNLVRAAIAQQVDAVVLGGDIYDSADREARQQLHFFDGLKQLDSAEIHVFIAHGNHDPVADTFTPVFGAMPERVHVFEPGDPQTFTFEVGTKTIAITGVSFATEKESNNLVKRIAATQISADLRIGVVHANVAGVAGHDNYGPCNTSDLQQSDIHYWALGHIHKQQITDIGNGRWWVYPGNLQGRSTKPAECGAKGVLVISAEGAGFARPEFHPCDVHRFIRLEIDLSGTETLEAARTAVVDAVLAAKDSNKVATITLRLQLTGTTDVPDLKNGFAAEDLESYIGDPKITIDRIDVATRHSVDRDLLIKGDDLVGILLQRIESLRSEISGEELTQLIKRLATDAGNPSIKRVNSALEREELAVGDLADRLEQIVLDRLVSYE